jgi:hypothetical protein
MNLASKLQAFHDAYNRRAHEPPAMTGAGERAGAGGSSGDCAGSTVRGDVMRNQEQMGGFVHRLGGSFQAVGPGIQAGAMTIDVAG